MPMARGARSPRWYPSSLEGGLFQEYDHGRTEDLPTQPMGRSPCRDLTSLTIDGPASADRRQVWGHALCLATDGSP